jgi:hypothetical protein
MIASTSLDGPHSGDTHARNFSDRCARRRQRDGRACGHQNAPDSRDAMPRYDEDPERESGQHAGRRLAATAGTTTTSASMSLHETAKAPVRRS